MACIRRGTIDDVFTIQQNNLYCLPENYQVKYYYFHSMTWPQLLDVATDSSDEGKSVGYVLGKIDDDLGVSHGHITSIAVLWNQRGFGISKKLLNQSHEGMIMNYKVPYCSLHVRVSNTVAKNLYQKSLNYSIDGIESKYYADNEDAYFMKLNFKENSKTTK
ncbi:N-acetyltransferase [Cryptosporidium bovis]|uniref:N-acetyltransferase n=1 Tax=Cryptosporidium bovis TaxID=310047 RepID=UPI00351A3520|nr:N-acetyltransferase [Cryptosporidium bovis]